MTEYEIPEVKINKPAHSWTDDDVKKAISDLMAMEHRNQSRYTMLRAKYNGLLRTAEEVFGKRNGVIAAIRGSHVPYPPNVIRHIAQIRREWEEEQDRRMKMNADYNRRESEIAERRDRRKAGRHE